MKNFIVFGLFLSLGWAQAVRAEHPNCLHGISSLAQIDGEHSAKAKYLKMGGSKVIAQCNITLYQVTEEDRAFVQKCISDSPKLLNWYLAEYSRGTSDFVNGVSKGCQK